MSTPHNDDERFDHLLDEISRETAAGSDAARERIWNRLAGTPPSPLCEGFRAYLAEYQAGTLPASRRLLLEDHLSRCPACRNSARPGTAQGGSADVIAMPAARRPAAAWRPYAIAAAAALAILYAGRGPIDRTLAGSGPRATVEAASGLVVLLNGEAAGPGTSLGEAVALRTGAGSRAVLRLSDGSRVEVNERTQLALHGRWSGLSVQLDRGDVLVEAAKQRRGHLRVLTTDTLASVKGTTFAVSSGSGGAVVSVVEGSVAVEHGGSSRLLGRGEQDGSASPHEGGVPAAIAWSQDAQKYLALLADFAHIEKQIAAIDTGVRTDPKLLPALPAGTKIYVSVPNSPAALNQALALVEQRARESAVLREWWESGAGREVRAQITALQTILPLLGDEIVFLLASDPARTRGEMPVILAQTKAQPADIDAALNRLVASKALNGASWRAANGLLIMTDTQARLAAVLPRLGQGAATAFAQEIRERYRRGVSILFGLDLEAIAASWTPDEQARANVAGAAQAKRLFVEQRSATQNEAALSFRGARQGVASWLAAPGSNGSAEYVSTDAVVAVTASTRNPRQAFDELVTRASAADPNFARELREFETKAGISVSADIAAALGTDFTFAIETPTAPVPGWVGVIEALRPGVLDATAQRLVDAFNQHLPADRQSMRLTLVRETVNGRAWTSLKSAASAMTLHWTQDAGYLVVSTDRAIATRALAVRAAGSGLLRSAAFRQQLPEGSGVHHSGLLWVNTKGALAGLLPPGETVLRRLLESRDPVLVTIVGETEQIRAASRTRLTSLVLDMALGGIAGHGQARPAAAKTLHARTRN